MRGVVHYYNVEKRYGFIRAFAGIADFFFDGKQVIGEPVQQGMEVGILARRLSQGEWTDGGGREAATWGRAEDETEFRQGQQIA